MKVDVGNYGENVSLRFFYFPRYAHIKNGSPRFQKYNIIALFSAVKRYLYILHTALVYLLDLSAAQ